MARTKSVPRSRSFLMMANTITPSTQVPPLPEELLALIIELLTPHHFETLYDQHLTARKTLAAICRVSKQCLRLARPVLYRRIDLDFRQNIVDLSKSLACSDENPALVQELSVESCAFHSTMELAAGVHVASRPLSEDWRPIFARALESCGSGVDEVGAHPLLGPLMNGFQDAHFAFSLMRCKYLDTLSFMIPFNFHESWTYSFLAQAAAASQNMAAAEAPLSRLRKLTKLYHPSKGTEPITELNDVLRLKSLKELRGAQIDILEERSSLEIQPSSLQVVDLNLAIVDAPGLRSLLRCCPELSSLSISWGTAAQGDCEVRWGLIGSALREYGRGLKFLTLDVSEANSWETWDIESHAPLGDLRALSSLESLDVSSIALFGVDQNGATRKDRLAQFRRGPIELTLPPSLVHLRVADWEELGTPEIYTETEEQEAGFVRALTVTDRMMNLKTVRIAGLAVLEEGSNLLQHWDVLLERQDDGSVSTTRNMPSLDA